MKKNERGVTLIALVVTIIVLLILAGVSIAMLTGDNGILTNAKKAQLANTEAEAIEKMNVAYNTAKTEVMVKTSTTSDYDATAKIDELATTIKKELGYKGETAPTGYSVTVDTDAKTITMTYADSTFSLETTETATEKNYKKVVGTITLTASDITYVAPTRQVN